MNYIVPSVVVHYLFVAPEMANTAIREFLSGLPGRSAVDGMKEAAFDK